MDTASHAEMVHMQSNAFLPKEGNYIVRNSGNNKALTYEKTEVPNMYPSRDGERLHHRSD